MGKWENTWGPPAIDRKKDEETVVYLCCGVEVLGVQIDQCEKSSSDRCYSREMLIGQVTNTKNMHLRQADTKISAANRSTNPSKRSKASSSR